MKKDRRSLSPLETQIKPARSTRPRGLFKLIIFFLVETLEKSWNTTYDWILKWYPLIKDEQIALAERLSGRS
ncbi:MAG: hypothetical protein A2846_02620 [Candidatus Doudnabacteria bacterium RIFCSPHIGHO2_01_FULL_49_9]|uniref:Uncharacterized protein n=1 Tax=Candidatus Doudnabacteria bacterium RIFCSPHIGHO2_01_FULL_49_9 TaxID=1817827 RepID=A0A1F5P3G4_9BACT|nr:MAG: hypothetical protein A2846_02620 [Candidatus Doudnabacteria bacterium RIFCSPHIGHO2_01_FULL_49_9]